MRRWLVAVLLLAHSTSSAVADRIRQTSDTDYYVDTEVGLDTNACSAAAPCKTLQRAIDHIQNDVDRAGFLSTVNVVTKGGPCNATLDPVLVVGPGVGGNGGFYKIDHEIVFNRQGIFLNGNVAAPGHCIIRGNGLDSIYAEGGGVNLQVAGFSVSTSKAGFGVHATVNAKIWISGPMDYGAIPDAYAQIYADMGGRLYIFETSYTVSGDAKWHVLVEDGGYVFIGDTKGSAIGSRSFQRAVFQAQGNAVIRSTGSSWSGSWNGKRYKVDTNGTILTFGRGADYFPGTVPGEATDGGIYK